MRRPVGRTDDGWLDVGSYGRRGLDRRNRLSPAQIDFIARTVRGTPEVVVKMLNGGGRNVRSVAQHLGYLNRHGTLNFETDTGERLSGREAGHALIDDWDLDLDEGRRMAELGPRAPKRSPKLIYKMVFSMPAGSPAAKVLDAVRVFAREEFALKHRYAMVLHTDEPHPHVHMVVKAVGDDGRRLDIRHAILRQWRREFARHLRAQGLEANASERVIRGVNRPQKIDAIYRAARRGASIHWDNRARLVAQELKRSGVRAEEGRAKLRTTRDAVIDGWSEIANALSTEGRAELARKVKQHVRRMPLPLTEKEFIAQQLSLLGSQDRAQTMPNPEFAR